MKSECIYKTCLGALLFVNMSTSVYANNAERHIEGVLGNIGQIYVRGSLTESACHIEMDSIDQSIDLGNIGTADLQHIGERAKSTTFNIKLKDCLFGNSILTDFKMGVHTWSTSQPIFKIRFFALQDELNPNTIKVNGAKGLGLELENAQGDPIYLGQFTRPVLIDKPQNILTYQVVPVRTGELEPSEYNAMIYFEFMYE